MIDMIQYHILYGMSVLHNFYGVYWFINVELGHNH